MKAIYGAIAGAIIAVAGLMIYSPNEQHPWMVIPIIVFALCGAALAR